MPPEVQTAEFLFASGQAVCRGSVWNGSDGLFAPPMPPERAVCGRSVWRCAFFTDGYRQLQIVRQCLFFAVNDCIYLHSSCLSFLIFAKFGRITLFYYLKELEKPFRVLYVIVIYYVDTT